MNLEQLSDKIVELSQQQLHLKTPRIFSKDIYGGLVHIRLIDASNGNIYFILMEQDDLENSLHSENFYLEHITREGANPWLSSIYQLKKVNLGEQVLLTL